MLIFSDGMTIDTSGPLRVIHKRDGLYVVGEGTCCPVDSRAEGSEIISDIVARRASRVTFPEH